MRMSKTNVVRTAVLALGTVGAGVVMAQDTPAASTASVQGRGMEGHHDPAQMEAHRLAMMTERLKLTPDQVAQIKAVDDAQHAQMMALRDDTATPPADKHAKVMALREDTAAKTRAVLTEEQKPKYDEMAARQRERMHHGEGAQGGTAPAPSAPPQ